MGIEFTDEFEAWWSGPDLAQQAAIAGRVELLGGDKSGQWNAWYRTAIPVADDLYDNYLKELDEEGLIE